VIEAVEIPNIETICLTGIVSQKLSFDTKVILTELVIALPYIQLFFSLD
jgi:hypothetical protein